MASSRQQVILHIGHGKTGSSYLQSSLALSVGSLRQAGIEYPELRSLAGARLGCITSGNLGSAVAFVDTIVQLAEQMPKATRLLFSSEWLFERIVQDLGTLTTLQAQFDLTLVLFTRDFLAHALSVYGQKVKRSGCTTNLSEHLSGYWMPRQVLRLLLRLSMQDVVSG
ncbi:MAG: hypothetical protein NTV57_02245 [Cyanobacteria bacterium]|nr:hypothetical protein [Cyanobacteriota bacterium]